MGFFSFCAISQPAAIKAISELKINTVALKDEFAIHFLQLLNRHVDANNTAGGLAIRVKDRGIATQPGAPLIAK